jgi:hypothetical protein
VSSAVELAAWAAADDVERAPQPTQTRPDGAGVPEPHGDTAPTVIPPQSGFWTGYMVGLISAGCVLLALAMLGVGW